MCIRDSNTRDLEGIAGIVVRQHLTGCKIKFYRPVADEFKILDLTILRSAPAVTYRKLITCLLPLDHFQRLIEFRLHMICFAAGDVTRIAGRDFLCKRSRYKIPFGIFQLAGGNDEVRFRSLEIPVFL